MVTQMEIADLTEKLENKKKQIEQFRGGIDIIERRINELLARMNR